MKWKRGVSLKCRKTRVKTILYIPVSSDLPLKMDFMMLIATVSGAIATMAAAAVAAVVVTGINSFKKLTKWNSKRTKKSGKKFCFKMTTNRKQETHEELDEKEQETLTELS